MKTIFDQVTDRWKEMSASIPQVYLGGKSPNVMIIDPGHGGTNPAGFYTTTPLKMFKHKDFTFLEGVWTRAIAWTLAYQLGKAQRNYFILVPGWYDITLRNRIAKAAQIKEGLDAGDRKGYVHSIHGNAFGLESVNGVEVFTSPGQNTSDELAEIYFEELEKLGWRMRPGYGDGDLDKEARFAMLTGPEKQGIPSILTETGFYTNEEQAREMCDLKTIDQIVEHMVDADVRIDYNNLLT